MVDVDYRWAGADVITSPSSACDMPQESMATAAAPLIPTAKAKTDRIERISACDQFAL